MTVFNTVSKISLVNGWPRFFLPSILGVGVGLGFFISCPHACRGLPRNSINTTAHFLENVTVTPEHYRHRPVDCFLVSSHLTAFDNAVYQRRQSECRLRSNNLKHNLAN